MGDGDNMVAGPPPPSGVQGTEPSSPIEASIPHSVQTKNIYSRSGFDMMRALSKVATRENPEVDIGTVDMSCAFVVCDVTQNDCPIIYVSDSFQNLTGYSRHDIIGKNCRFLQSPDGKVEAGSRRQYVDNTTVYHLRTRINSGREVQRSLLNYRKGGTPFFNLLTIIPIPWDTDEIRYLIGFQIDLVDCPGALSPSSSSRQSVKVTYGQVSPYIWSPPMPAQDTPDRGQTLGIDDISLLLQQPDPDNPTSDWQKQSWDRMLLENTDDLAFVLSLKGVFQYLSPSCKSILEYDASELLGNALSAVCHPSDIVSVTRELRDAVIGNPVNVIFRIKRKQSGYIWFESHGSLFTEHGKGRKSIILVGRQRPTFNLPQAHLEEYGNPGDEEFWAKLSPAGLLIFVSRLPDSLAQILPELAPGLSIQSFFKAEFRPEFGRAIEKARRGKTMSIEHQIRGSQGQLVEMRTVLYPGNVTEGQKPSFLLMRMARAETAPLGQQTQSLTDTSGQMVVASAESSGASHNIHDDFEPSSGRDDRNVFDELRTTRCTNWQFELRRLERVNRALSEELGRLSPNKKRRK